MSGPVRTAGTRPAGPQGGATPQQQALVDAVHAATAELNTAIRLARRGALTVSIDPAAHLPCYYAATVSAVTVYPSTREIAAA